MKFEQLEFLKKKMEAVALGISGRSYYTYDKGQKEKELMDRVGNVQDMLRSMASVADCFLGMLMDDMKVKDNPEPQKPIEFPVQEVNQNDVFVLDNKGSLKQILRPIESKDQEASVIPFCIEELSRINKKLSEYTPSNPELAELTIQEIVCKLSIKMQIQNNVLMTALRHLMGETPRTTVPIKDNNKVKQTPIRRSIHFNYQETDGREPLGDIELFHSYQVDELTSEFYKEMQVKALSQLREIEAKAGRYEILIWHGEKIAGTDTGTLALLRKEPGI